jgi:hypothetical protein
MVKAIALASLLALSACQTPSGSFCAIEAPLRPSAAEISAMSDATVAALLAHNLKGQKLCRWKP